MGRSNHQDRRQCAAVYVAVVLQYAVCRHYGQGRVFIRAVHIVHRYRFVVHSLYRDRYRRYIAVQRAIVRLVRKGIRAN